MANPEHLATLRKGVQHWNEWRIQNPDIRPDFHTGNLTGIDLRRVDLRTARLQLCELRGCDLSEANLRDTLLASADLSGANLTGANLANASLRGTKLCDAILTRACFSYCDLERVDFRGAKLRHGVLRSTNLYCADLSDADLFGACLNNASLVETNLERADLTGCQIYGVSTWNVKLGGAVQSNLRITPPNEPTIQVDNLEVAQFIYLLLNNQKIRDVIDTIGRKAVLVLGRFTPSRKAILDAIREELRSRGYLPILFDFEKPGTRDTQETLTTLAGMSRFVIADITDARSVPQELAAIVPILVSVPVQPLLQVGSERWAMYDHFARYHWVLPIVHYENQETLLAILGERVIGPAERKASEQMRGLNR